MLQSERRSSLKERLVDMKNRSIADHMAFFDLLSSMNVNLIKSCIKRHGVADSGERYCIMDALYGYDTYKCESFESCDACIQRWMNEDRRKERL